MTSETQKYEPPKYAYHGEVPRPRLGDLVELSAWSWANKRDGLVWAHVTALGFQATMNGSPQAMREFGRHLIAAADAIDPPASAAARDEDAERCEDCGALPDSDHNPECGFVRRVRA